MMEGYRYYSETNEVRILMLYLKDSEKNKDIIHKGMKEGFGNYTRNKKKMVSILYWKE